MIKLYPPIVIAVLFLLNSLLGMNWEFPKAPYTASFHSTLIDDGFDLIFPSVIHAEKRFKNPLANYYMYTSPHGGASIRLYLADSFTGPWRYYGEVVNADIARAEHVSSPHAVWNEEAGKLFFYVHAPNAQTVYCHSDDGIHFEYGDVCVTRYMLSDAIGFKTKSASYARVQRYTIPEYNNTWTMTVTASGGKEPDGSQKNASVLCTSDDGKKWTARRVVIDEGKDGKVYKTLDACYLPLDGRHFMVYTLRNRTEEKGNRTEKIQLHISEGDANWRNWKYLGLFYEPSWDYPDFGAARGLSLVPGSEGPLLYYEPGHHGAARIGMLSLDKGKLSLSD